MSAADSAVPAESTENTGGSSGHGQEHERFLPIANISRCMKTALPDSAKISREAKELVQEATSEFISFITSESSDKCVRERRKTICGEDILYAMRTLGFEEYIAPLMAYLERYRSLEQAKRHEKQASGASAGSDDEEGDSGDDVVEDSADDDAK
ncbi:hypothetical protein CCYA_CCYA15G3931 [Cyanidiococcus yangmingshanensis]|nr:hypothetical protein CCYA_CCYA15G3931 [Cyanidiococcus yangmingshanensis]